MLGICKQQKEPLAIAAGHLLFQVGIFKEWYAALKNLIV
jgi:hypothetical protein